MNAIDIGYAIVAAATAPVWMRKARGGWPQRLGRVSVAPRGGRPRVMLHAVSVGEARALRTLVPLLTDDLDVVVTAGTDTGLETAERLYGGSCRVCRYPLDFSGSVRRFLDTVRPDAVALVELELWPQFTAACARRGIPVGVINGRLSERSFRGYRRFRPILGPMFRRLAFAAVQDEAYARRFIEMGVDPGRVRVTGSMKWDNAEVRDRVEGADELAAALGLDRSRPIVVAGSTGPGEEALLHAALEGIDAQLVCAPRRPERFDEAAAAMPGCVRRSQPGAATAADRFLLDSIGELGRLYAIADVVVIGRSFGDQHGSDPSEPAGLGKPLVAGPAMGDFATMVGELEAAGAIVRVTRPTLSAAVRRLVEHPDDASRIGAAARDCVALQRGASARHAEMIRVMVASSPAAGGDYHRGPAGRVTTSARQRP